MKLQIIIVLYKFIQSIIEKNSNFVVVVVVAIDVAKIS